MVETEYRAATGVYSETGPLKKVLLHRPGDEIKILGPNIAKDFLFEGVPYLAGLQEQHDAFARVLKKEGCSIYYYGDILTEILADSEVRVKAIDILLSALSIQEQSYIKSFRKQLWEMPPHILCDKLIGGIPILDSQAAAFGTSAGRDVINPMPNLYFTRDIGLVIGNGMVLANMSSAARRREPALLGLLLSHHPLFSQLQKNLWYDGRKEEGNLECGDILILSSEALAMGLSARSQHKNMEIFAKQLFSRGTEFQRILAVEMPHEEAFFHLDLILTMVDRNKFAYYPVMHQELNFYIMQPAGRNNLKIEEEKSLEKALEKALGFSEVELITCMPPEGTEMTRTFYNDGANTLAISPGRVLLYGDDKISTQALEESGVEIVKIEGSELTLGRGGPHCMSMPLERKD